MDHTEAVRLQAAVRYVLGELQPSLREEYEEHYFDCAECALDLKSAAAFANGSREFFRQEARESARAPRKEAAPQGWLRWFRPVIAVPAFAALLAVMVFQNAVTIPKAQNAGAMQLTEASATLANTRGEGSAKVSARPNTAIPVDFDFTPSRSFNSYVARLQEDSGRQVSEISIPADKANRTLHLLIPAGAVHPGTYTLLISGDPAATGHFARDNEVQRLAFTIELIP